MYEVIDTLINNIIIVLFSVLFFMYKYLSSSIKIACWKYYFQGFTSNMA